MGGPQFESYYALAYAGDVHANVSGRAGVRGTEDFQTGAIYDQVYRGLAVVS